MSSSSPHSELIESLDEFYTLLFELGAMTRDYLRRPDPATGRHPGDALNADAARAAGYSEDAVCLLYQLPYIGTSFSEYQIDILYDSVPVDYLAVKDEVQFEDLREMYDDEMLPSSTVRLTRTCVYGTNLVYDVDARRSSHVSCLFTFFSPPIMQHTLCFSFTFFHRLCGREKLMLYFLSSHVHYPKHVYFKLARLILHQDYWYPGSRLTRLRTLMICVTANLPVKSSARSSTSGAVSNGLHGLITLTETQILGSDQEDSHLTTQIIVNV